MTNEYSNNKECLVFEKDGYKYQNTYNGFIKTDNPKKWGKNNPFSIENISRWLKEVGATCTVESKEYNVKRISLRCSCGNVYNVSMSNLVTNRQFNCPSCGRAESAKKHNQMDRFLSVLKNKGITMLEEYTTAKRSYYMMTVDGYYIRSSPWNIENGFDERDTIFDECNKYSIENMRKWLKDNSPTLELLSDKYIGAKERYSFKCSCGNEFETNWQYLRCGNVTRCPTCSKKVSSIELKTIQWLEDNGFDYVREKAFDGCRDKFPLRFDFYIPSRNTLIEVDGEQHFRPVAYGGISKDAALKNFNKSKRRDLIKDEFCKNNGYTLMRIPFWQYENGEYTKTLESIYG